MTARALTALTIVLCAALAAAGCGDDEDETTTAQSGAAGAEGPAPEREKPNVEVPDGPPPTDLVVDDLVKGDGTEAEKGDEVTVNYVGVDYATGKEFDASFDRGEPFTFLLGGGMVIPGWDEGVEGMRVGGRRELVIPPDLAYGKQGQPPVIKPNSTLVFVIDLLDVR